MRIQMKRIRLDEIRLETNFRSKEKDLSLEMSLQRHGLQVPLIVEGEHPHQYVLLDGHRRFYALQFLGMSWAECAVKPLTSASRRAIWRLREELHSGNKRSEPPQAGGAGTNVSEVRAASPLEGAYHLDKMVRWLVKSCYYDPADIAKLCQVEEEVILRFLPGAERLRRHARADDLRREQQEEWSLYSEHLYPPLIYGAMVYNPMSYSIFGPLDSMHDLAFRRLAEMDKILGDVYFY